MPPLIIEEEMGVMSSGDDYYAGPISTEMLKDICDGSQSHMSVKRREARYRIRDCIKRIQAE